MAKKSSSNNQKLVYNYTSQYIGKLEKENNRNNMQILDARIQKRKRKEIKKKKKRLDHHIADLTSKFYEKHNPCHLKIVIVILWRTTNTKPK